MTSLRIQRRHVVDVVKMTISYVQRFGDRISYMCKDLAIDIYIGGDQILGPMDDIKSHIQ